MQWKQAARAWMLQETSSNTKQEVIFNSADMGGGKQTCIYVLEPQDFHHFLSEALY